MIHPPVKCARDVTDEESDFLSVFMSPAYSVSGVDTVNTWDLIEALERHSSEKSYFCFTIVDLVFLCKD
jgi:hypothetical protein